MTNAAPDWLICDELSPSDCQLDFSFSAETDSCPSSQRSSMGFKEKALECFFYQNSITDMCPKFLRDVDEHNPTDSFLNEFFELQHESAELPNDCDLDAI
jgi:hypothetical protein